MVSVLCCSSGTPQRGRDLVATQRTGPLSVGGTGVGDGVAVGGWSAGGNTAMGNVGSAAVRLGSIAMAYSRGIAMGHLGHLGRRATGFTTLNAPRELWERGWDRATDRLDCLSNGGVGTCRHRGSRGDRGQVPCYWDVVIYEGTCGGAGPVVRRPGYAKGGAGDENIGTPAWVRCGRLSVDLGRVD